MFMNKELPLKKLMMACINMTWIISMAIMIARVYNIT